MIIRNSKRSDTDEIMNILAQARESIGKLGIDQWQYGYPTRDIIADDINKGRSYVCEEDGKVIAVFSVITDGEPTYDDIYNGKWTTPEFKNGACSYHALHRIAISNKKRGSGLAGQIINFIKSKCIEDDRMSIRVDTHKGNLPMRKMLEKNGFEYCGVIYLKDGQERVAYELVIDESDSIMIYDITRELISAPVYNGDTAPTLTKVKSISNGDRCNLSDLTMCVHNGTHMDSPLHFIDGTNSINEIPLSKCVGDAYVVYADKDITSEFIDSSVPCDCRRLLIKGNRSFEVGTAEALAKKGIVLVGVEGQSVATPDKTMAVHIEILGKDIVILEGICLDAVSEGKYELYALPTKIAGAEGAPCRAILIKR